MITISPDLVMQKFMVSDMELDKYKMIMDSVRKTYRLNWISGLVFHLFIITLTGYRVQGIRSWEKIGRIYKWIELYKVIWIHSYNHSK